MGFSHMRKLNPVTWFCAGALVEGWVMPIRRRRRTRCLLWRTDRGRSNYTMVISAKS